MSVTERIRILKTVELADFEEKNAKRVRILKTVELADFAEKKAKKNENSERMRVRMLFGRAN